MREAFERHVGNTDPTRLLFKRGGSVFAEDIPGEEYVDGNMRHRWKEWQAAWTASLESGLVGVTMESERRKLYEELLYAVHRKFPGESRQETALRYIRQAEANANDPTPCHAQKSKGEPT